jgi:hypothetical protein
MGKGSVPGANMNLHLTGFLSILPKINGKKSSHGFFSNRVVRISPSGPVWNGNES